MREDEEGVFDSGKRFVYQECVEATKGAVELDKELSFYDSVELAKSFCYLGSWLNAISKSGIAVTARTRIGWIKFKKCGKFVMEESFC